MNYRLLGRSGLRVSELCLGTMTFGEEWAGARAARRVAGSAIKVFTGHKLVATHEVGLAYPNNQPVAWFLQQFANQLRADSIRIQI